VVQVCGVLSVKERQVHIMRQ